MEFHLRKNINEISFEMIYPYSLYQNAYPYRIIFGVYCNMKNATHNLNSNIEFSHYNTIVLFLETKSILHHSIALQIQLRGHNQHKNQCFNE